ncbi:MAG: serpin family protein [Vicinamibacteria bacterium]|nr:serpin family protein [Vicinamibacteria bacterium]
MPPFVCFALTVLASVISPACSTNLADHEIVSSSLSRDMNPAVPTDDLAAQVRANTAFALDLYHELASAPDNVFFSPHSISVALAMTWAGARGQTAQSMAQALHFDLPQERLHSTFNALDLALASRGHGAQGSDGKEFRLRSVNSLWAQKDVSFLAPFLDVLAVSYGAVVHLMDFVSDAEGARQTINAWVEEQTEERIENLIPEGTLGSLTRLVLVNAVYFNAAWADQFEAGDTRTEPFILLDGNSVSAPMMHQVESFPYAAGPGYQAVELPYDGQELSMLILVPDTGSFTSFETQLNADRLLEISASLSKRVVALGLPRWELKGLTFSLKEKLSHLGMGVAFTDQADFSGMNGVGDLQIHDILHQAFIKVNETGTEAAAATAVVISATSADPGMPVLLRVDRPFIYLIRDRATGAVLFLGRVLNPN